MIEDENRPFTPTTALFPFRGDRDEALNAFYPKEVSEGEGFGSSDPGEPQRWISMMVDEKEAELFLRIVTMVGKDEEVSRETRYFAQKLGELFQACILSFADYEERKAAGLPASTPIAS